MIPAEIKSVFIFFSLVSIAVSAPYGPVAVNRVILLHCLFNMPCLFSGECTELFMLSASLLEFGLRAFYLNAERSEGRNKYRLEEVKLVISEECK